MRFEAMEVGIRYTLNVIASADRSIEYPVPLISKDIDACTSTTVQSGVIKVWSRSQASDRVTLDGAD